MGAQALVTLMQPDELSAVGINPDALHAEVRKREIEWHYLPVADVRAPDDEFEDLWTYSGFRLRAILACGGDIAVHCLGGLGRTGTVAARLLVEFGDSPEIAIQKVRAARNGSIETAAQERYVRCCRAVQAAQVHRSVEERILACILGGAVGDAFGFEVEFDNISAIRERFGDQGLHSPVFHNGLLIVSDDTQMTLFTVEGLLRGFDQGAFSTEKAHSAIRKAYLDWLQTQFPWLHGGAQRESEPGWLARQPSLRVQRAPGTTCLSALEARIRGTNDRKINNSKGCGAAMRSAPFGLVTALDPAAAFDMAASAATLTHGHPSGYLSAAVVAGTVRCLVDGVEFAEAVRRSAEILRVYPDHAETLRALNQALSAAGANPTDHVSTIESMGGGWVGEEAVAIAIYSVLVARSFAEAVCIAANHSGDSDSTAAIAGQFWGAPHGLSGMPHEWIAALDVLRPLLHVTRQLLAQAQNSADALQK